MIKKTDFKNMKKLQLGLALTMLISVPVMSKTVVLPKPKVNPHFESKETNITNKTYLQAEDQYSKHNYQEAVDLYKKVLTQKIDDYTKKETLLKLIQSLIMAKKWDESITNFNNSLKLYTSDNYWQARLNVIGATLYQVITHQGYKRNNQIFRDENTTREGTYVYIYKEDQESTNKYFKNAKNYYYKVTPSKTVNQEIINLNFDYAQYLGIVSIVPPVRPLEKTVSNIKTYPENLTIEQQIIFLFDEVFTLNQLVKDFHNEVMSLFKKAHYFVRKNGISFDYNTTQDSNIKTQNPLPILEKIVKNYPKDELAPEALYGIGQIYSSKGNYVSALEYYQDVIKKYPKSVRVSDAKSEIQEITSKYLTINNPGVQLSKDKPKISISAKNIKNITIKIYKTDLIKTLKSKINEPDLYFNNFNQNFGEKISDIKKYAKEKVLTLNTDTGYKGDYQASNKEITLPDLKAGAYLVEASDGTSNNSISLMLISDMTIVKNIDKDKAIIHILDRESGKPLKDTNILIREHYYDNSDTDYKNKVRFIENKTDANGSIVYKKYDKANSYSYIDVLAWKGEEAIFSNAQYYYNYYNQNNSYKAYIYTDRPVYRPEQTVNFKEIITLYNDGKNKNLENKNVKVRITDAKGDLVYEKDLTTNKFGTINDSFKLKKDTSLGIYYISTTVENGSVGITQSGGQNFRVEEYKKPEFIVNVKADNPQFKPGDKVKVNISTDYYFGSPVSGATVKYKIVRTPFYYYYYPYSRSAWFDYERIYNPNYNEQSGSVWKEGELTTNNEGKVSLEFDTEKSTTDYKYDVLVDVTDKSRRQIKGASSVKVTNSPYFAFINLEQGFYTPNENAKIEINLRSPNDEPIEDSGKLKIYSVKYTGKNNEKEELTLLLTKDVKSDKNGQIFYTWKTGKEGNYKIVFENNDEKVKGENSIWINGKNFDGRYYKFQNVELLTDKMEYKEGDTARLMLSTNYPDSYVLLYTETDKSILGHKLLFIPNKSKVLEIKIEKHHVPNFNIKALLIKDSVMYLQNKEVFVPPAKQLLNVDISTVKEKYLPGEKASVNIKTTDSNGKPVPAEVSLSVADSSVYYIQDDLSGDIKKFYYGERRYFQSNTSTSLDLYLYTVNESTDKKENYPRHSGPFDDYFVYGLSSNVAVKQSMVGKPSSRAMPAAPMAEASFEAPRERREDVASDAAAPMPLTKGKKDSGQEMKSAEIRAYFPDTALWKPVVTTNSQGNAIIDFDFPDSLTTWRISSNAIDKNSRVGGATDEVITRKNIIARLQAPRFFVEKDEVVLSGLINNDLDTDKTVKCIIETGSELENTQNKEVDIVIPAKSEKRVDWRFKVKKEGNTKITLKALTDVESDASATEFPVYVHGIDKYIAQNGQLKENENSKDLTLNIPTQRKKDSTKLNITLNTSVASTLIDSIPYLASYPYGCVEQTTSRFIPALLVNKIVKKAGIDISTLTQSKQNRENTKFLDKKTDNPVYNNAVLDDMAKTGLKRIYSFQNGDGGFGWWNGFQSDTYMTSYVTYSLLLAKQADYSVDNNVIEKALSFLTNKFNSDEEIYDRLYIAYVLSMDKRIKLNSLDNFFKNRDTLNNYGKALLSLAYSNLGDKAKADLICQNLKTFVVTDNDTASWKNDTRWYWYWYGDRIETNTYILQAFLKSRPNDKLVPMIAKWILQNRQGNHWYSTKDTANAIYTLTEYASLHNELNPDYTLSVFYGDKLLQKTKVNKANMFSFSNSLTLSDKDIIDGNKIRIVKEGKGNLYYSSALEYFSLEDNIKAASNMISVKREYYKLKENKDKDNKIVYDKTLIKEGETLKSGDLIEVKLTLGSNNDYEYLIFEDMKPSGFESTELKSAYEYQNGMSLNKELRDEKTVFFANNLPQGTQVITYKLRAETPGIFHALPNKSYAMYAPQIKANSDEATFKVID